MTAVVGILNKQAVAIAADSAVTIGGKTILNKSNKVFTLSKYHPVGLCCIIQHHLCPPLGKR